MSDLQKLILETLANGDIENSVEFAQSVPVDHHVVVDQFKALSAYSVVDYTAHTTMQQVLTDEGLEYSDLGSPEFRLFSQIPDEGIARADLQKAVGDLFKKGFSHCMKKKTVKIEKGTVVKIGDMDDSCQMLLNVIRNGGSLSKGDFNDLKRRKLVNNVKILQYSATAGEEFDVNWQKPVTDLTSEMLQAGNFENLKFKPINFNADGLKNDGGYLHPLLKVREEFRQIFLELGFEEMSTNLFCESSFWNFDSLFQPQQHPVRDAHDTFFLSKPEFAGAIPADYLERVKEMHEDGDEDSIGWRYNWAEVEARKNILRTHTTAVSARTLYNLAQDGFQPKKFFSIDRVFRNETLDATHLAEFHQIEGIVIDKGLGLAHLMGIMEVFFERIGIQGLRYKAAYNPYTEPSMEVFGYHPGLGKWIELGNSGIFRPEMLKPMGLPEDATAIAWGISLERPTMIKYGIDNIRDLFGYKTKIDFITGNPICRLDEL
eukprot:TRINITY_DN11271_c0_g1_i1.p1 TRINITY_DN11271_c0_g1~~TRINITY_DN11271_c0_g1_i1.p1  ORF type:complete len:503 (-),score=138.72 TRINITY_DN11271_c0_g1_i1:35-1498(-)